MKAKIDYIFIGILGLLIIYTIFTIATTDYTVGIENYAGMVCWLIVVVLRIISRKAGRYALVVLLILSTITLLNFTVVKFYFLGLYPLPLLMLIVFYFLNRESFYQIYLKMFYGDSSERANAYQQKIDFYMDMFGKFDDEQFAMAVKDLDDYPPEAQVALNKLRNIKVQI